MRRVRVLAPYYAPAVAGGGPIRTLGALTASAPVGTAVEIVTRDRDLGGTERLPVPRGEVVDGRRRVRYLDARGVSGLVRLARAIARRPSPDLVYVNSVFDARFGVLPMLLHRVGLSRGRALVAPRGEFDPGALALKAAKKRRYLAVARAAGVFRTVTWHASTELEAAHIRAVAGPDAEVVVRENETDLPVTAVTSPLPAGDRLELVAVGRISPKKRLHLVIEGLAAVTRPVRLVVIGPVDDEVYGQRCRAAATRLPDHVVVVFAGVREHDDALRAVAASHAMVSATAGENFGHTIAESLSVGRPVLLSDTTPWTERVRSGGGSVVPDDGWPDTLRDWAATTAGERRRRAIAAADAYDDWRRRPAAPHVFDLVLGHD